MREKRLRKQKENQATSTGQPEQSGPKSGSAASEEKPSTVIRPRITGPAASPPAIESSNKAPPSVQQRLGLKPQTPPSIPLVVPQRKSPEPQPKDDSRAPSPKKLKRSPSATSPGHVADLATSPGLQEPQTEIILETPKIPPVKAVETKGTEVKFVFVWE